MRGSNDFLEPLGKLSNCCNDVVNSTNNRGRVKPF